MHPCERAPASANASRNVTARSVPFWLWWFSTSTSRSSARRRSVRARSRRQDGEDAEEVVAYGGRRRVAASVAAGGVVCAARRRDKAEQHQQGGSEQEGSSRRGGAEVPAGAVVVLGHRRRTRAPWEPDRLREYDSAIDGKLSADRAGVASEVQTAAVSVKISGSWQVVRLRRKRGGVKSWTLLCAHSQRRATTPAA